MTNLKTKNLFFSLVALLISATMFSVGCDNGSSFFNNGSMGAFSKINNNIVSVFEVTASSHIKNDKPENTIDVDFSSKWSAKGFGEWIKYDLGVTKNIESVDIFFINKKKMNYRFSIDLSIDEEIWKEVYIGKSITSTEGFENFAFTSTLARYVRIKGYNNYKKENVEIAEVEINAISDTDDCKYGDGKNEYDAEYNSRKYYLEYSWKKYNCDNIDEFNKNTKHDSAPSGYCSEKAFKKATKDVISDIKKECDDYCKSGDGEDEYEREYNSRKSNLENSWESYTCDNIDEFSKNANHDSAPSGYCSEKAFNKATKDVISYKKHECEDSCESGDGMDEYNKEYNSRKDDLENSWEKYDCENIDKFTKDAKHDMPPTGYCSEKAFNKATKDVVSNIKKECDGDNCKSGDGKDEYEREYDSRKSVLEYTWLNYGCDKIDKFIKDVKHDRPLTGYCGEKGFDKATKKVISDKEKECDDCN